MGAFTVVVVVVFGGVAIYQIRFTVGQHEKDNSQQVTTAILPPAVLGYDPKGAAGELELPGKELSLNFYVAFPQLDL